MCSWPTQETCINQAILSCCMCMTVVLVQLCYLLLCKEVLCHLVNWSICRCPALKVHKLGVLQYCILQREISKGIRCSLGVETSHSNVELLHLMRTDVSSILKPPDQLSRHDSNEQTGIYSVNSSNLTFGSSCKLHSYTYLVIDYYCCCSQGWWYQHWLLGRQR